MTHRYWPGYRADKGLVMNASLLFDAIKQSDMTDEQKDAILAKMSAYDSSFRTTNYSIKETILQVLREEARPMRIKELRGANYNHHTWSYDGPLGVYTHQRINAHMRQLIMAGLVKRSVIKTGRTIETNSGKTIEETFVTFEII